MEILDKIAQTGTYTENYRRYLEANNIYMSYKTDEKLSHLSKRENEPMKLAVSGVFSSGKSTFLNAMLADDILPSGNLPITSKITYLRYGKDPQLKLTYIDGREEFASVESIAKYVSQQSEEQIQNIDHITLYYPKEILKDIVFVDTPGFNSPNKMDDETTDEILKNVDGIIWLTMISNAGKQSEIDVLKEYFEQYKEKSVCIVNHKDEIDDEDEVAEFIEELQEDSSFSAFFSDIIAISAKQAFQSRQKNQKQIMLKLARNFSNELEDKLIAHIEKENLLQGYEEIMKEDLVHFLREYNTIKKGDIEENRALLEESNIEEIFEYIDKSIAPKAKEALSFSVKKEITYINESIIEHYKYLVGAFSDLETILYDFNIYQEHAIENLYDTAKTRGIKNYHDVVDIVDILTDIVTDSFELVENGEFIADGEKTFWGDTPTGEWIDVYKFNDKYIANQLSEENGEFAQAKVKLEESLKKTYYNIINKVSHIQEELQKNMEVWKDKYAQLVEFSEENLLLNRYALESFDLFVNDFENQVIRFDEILVRELKYIYDLFTAPDNILNLCFRCAFSFDNHVEAPRNFEVNERIILSISLDFTEAQLQSDETVFIRLLNDIKKSLFKISSEKLDSFQPTKNEWNSKLALLGYNSIV